MRVSRPREGGREGGVHAVPWLEHWVVSRQSDAIDGRVEGVVRAAAVLDDGDEDCREDHRPDEDERDEDSAADHGSGGFCCGIGVSPRKSGWDGTVCAWFESGYGVRSMQGPDVAPGSHRSGPVRGEDTRSRAAW